jgi:hypothetical protein
MWHVHTFSFPFYCTVKNAAAAVAAAAAAAAK